MVTPEIMNKGKIPRAGISWFRKSLKICLGLEHREKKQDKWAGQVREHFRVLLYLEELRMLTGTLKQTT